MITVIDTDGAGLPAEQGQPPPAQLSDADASGRTLEPELSFWPAGYDASGLTADQSFMRWPSDADASGAAADTDLSRWPSDADASGAAVDAALIRWISDADASGAAVDAALIRWISDADASGAAADTELSRWITDSDAVHGSDPEAVTGRPSDGDTGHGSTAYGTSSVNETCAGKDTELVILPGSGNFLYQYGQPGLNELAASIVSEGINWAPDASGNVALPGTCSYEYFPSIPLALAYQQTGLGTTAIWAAPDMTGTWGQPVQFQSISVTASGNEITSSTLTLSASELAFSGGASVTGAQIVADGASGQILVYSGPPASGNLIGYWSGAAGTDAQGNSFYTGAGTQQLLLYGNASPATPAQANSSVVYSNTNGTASVKSSSGFNGQISVAQANIQSFTASGSTPAGVTAAFTIEADDANVATCYRITSWGTGTYTSGSVTWWAPSLAGVPANAEAKFSSLPSSFTWEAVCDVIVHTTGSGGTADYKCRVSVGGQASQVAVATAVSLDTTTATTYSMQCAMNGTASITGVNSTFERLGP